MVIQVCIGPDFDLKLAPHLDDFDDKGKMLAWFQKIKPVLTSEVRKLLDESGFRKTQAITNDQRHPARARS